MVPSQSNFASEKLSLDEKKFFDRQMRLPGWNQETLKDSTVLIAGIGGLGCEVAKNLAMSGVGTLILVDLDRIEYSNLNRQILFVGASEGEAKAEAAARNLKQINPNAQYIAFPKALELLPPEMFDKVDLVISGLDSISARNHLNRLCVHQGKPMVDAGTLDYNGHMYTIFPGENACLECDPLKEPEIDRLAACTLVGVPRKKIHCLLKGQLYFEQEHNRTPDVYSPEEMKIVIDYANDLVRTHFPSEEIFTYDEAVKIVDRHDATVIVVNAVMAALQSMEAIKILHKLKKKPVGEPLKNYIIYNGLSGKFYNIEKPPNKKCALCGPDAPPLIEMRFTPHLAVESQLAGLKQHGYDLDPNEVLVIVRLDSLALESIEPESTPVENEFRNGETFLVSGFRGDKEIYLKVLI
ncbi:MAG: ThiF family adenylyltransferase [Candidatus Hodarchaeota archaeon]